MRITLHFETLQEHNEYIKSCYEKIAEKELRDIHEVDLLDFLKDEEHNPIITNADFYKKEISEVDFSKLAFDINKNKIVECYDVDCSNCKFSYINTKIDEKCSEYTITWLNQPYKEEETCKK